jgi:hypothetical protein
MGDAIEFLAVEMNKMHGQKKEKKVVKVKKNKIVANKRGCCSLLPSKTLSVLKVSS